MNIKNKFENDEYIEKAMHDFKVKIIDTKQNIIEFKGNFNKMYE